MNIEYETTKVLKSFRARAGKNQEESGKLLGWHPNTYSKKEKFPLDATVIELCEITSVLNGNIEELFNALEQDFKSYKKLQKC